MSAGKAEVKSVERILESRNDVFNSIDVAAQLTTGIHVRKRPDVFKKYLEGEIRLECQLSQYCLVHSLDFEPQKFILTAEKVKSVNALPINNAPLGIRGNAKSQLRYDGSNDAQPPVPVQSGEVMDVAKCSRNASLGIAFRFFTRVRLYGFKPSLEIFREWEFQETTVFEFAGDAVNDGKLYSICIGGRLGSLGESDGIPYQSIESRTQLISVFSNFERQGIAANPLQCCRRNGSTNNEPPAVFFVSKDRGNAVICKDTLPFRLEREEVVCRALSPAPAIFEFWLRSAHIPT